MKYVLVFVLCLIPACVSPEVKDAANRIAHDVAVIESAVHQWDKLSTADKQTAEHVISQLSTSTKALATSLNR